ncbi:50S ribosomal protein L11 methyltransferase [Polymorphobacter fuscus]|uniref:Ribosomal protein L11 methyltransferase n=1 Tax=Sandarakinorhabdus fusca TaxID=1439888 RepID=A0A7C9KGB5_9SPHN|nr:50S ribosomal protein L11 methyltransferase [Polymorphobacter fuscus]KAB7648440.1 50S ribosomal protein L11 methyltransferase [Polymorphobacter fuscus]MQT15960.1 methyltransferase [Polymorphobacter fuscus]NJC07763.1 ribosomal protein L11 methyltransferase [Polymorphobacter fuscus]
MSGNAGWTLTLACTRADAEAMPEIGDVFPDLADPPSLNVEEPDPDAPDAWVLTAYFNDEPDPALVDRIVALFPSAADVVVAPLAEADWTTMSQRDLEPVRAGRFLVHTRAHADAVRPGDIALGIEAGLAFGTGQHATTLGCLRALDRLARRRRFANIADLGTGTGVLALAAARRWPKARVIASDIDPVSIAVTRANLRDNKVAAGHAAGQIALVVAAGMDHRLLAAGAPYDLIIANILAPPLVAISRPVSAALAPGGVLVLAGLLRSHAVRVRGAYRKHGLVPLEPQRGRGEWPCVVLTRP